MAFLDAETGEVVLNQEITLQGGMPYGDLGKHDKSRFPAGEQITFSVSDTPWGQASITLRFHQGALMSLNIWFSAVTSKSILKNRNDELLISCLGDPTGEKRIAKGFLDRWLLPIKQEPWLLEAKELRWELPWGKVFSAVDPSDGDPVIWIHWVQAK